MKRWQLSRHNLSVKTQCQSRRDWNSNWMVEIFNHRTMIQNSLESKAKWSCKDKWLTIGIGVHHQPANPGTATRGLSRNARWHKRLSVSLWVAISSPKSHSQHSKSSSFLSHVRNSERTRTLMKCTLQHPSRRELLFPQWSLVWPKTPATILSAENLTLPWPRMKTKMLWKQTKE